MNALKTMVFGLAALGAVSLSSAAAAATTVLSYLGNTLTYDFGTRVLGDRVTATIELADPLGADFLGAVSWLSLSMSDGVQTVSQPELFRAFFATNAAGEIVNWWVAAFENPNAIGFSMQTVNATPGQFGLAAVSDRSTYFGYDEYSNASVNETPGVWTVTTRADPGVVPEPAAWALMIVGFGSSGAMLRRHRQRLKAA